MQYALTLNDFSPGRRMAIIGTLGALGTIAPFSIDLYLPALPTLGSDLGASQQQVAVTVTMFLLGLAFGQMQAGALSDTHGRRLPLLAGLLLYTLASLVCALAPNVQVLMAARFLQGLGGAAAMAISYACVTDYARGREAARLMSRLLMIGGIAPVIAPLIGSASAPWRPHSSASPAAWTASPWASSSPWPAYWRSRRSSSSSGVSAASGKRPASTRPGLAPT